MEFNSIWDFLPPDERKRSLEIPRAKWGEIPFLFNREKGDDAARLAAFYKIHKRLDARKAKLIRDVNLSDAPCDLREPENVKAWEARVEQAVANEGLGSSTWHKWKYQYAFDIWRGAGPEQQAAREKYPAVIRQWWDAGCGPVPSAEAKKALADTTGYSLYKINRDYELCMSLYHMRPMLSEASRACVEAGIIFDELNQTMPAVNRERIAAEQRMFTLQSEYRTLSETWITVRLDARGHGLETALPPEAFFYVPANEADVRAELAASKAAVETPAERTGKRAVASSS